MADAVPIRRPSSILDEIREMQDRVMRRAYEIFERHGGKSVFIGRFFGPLRAVIPLVRESPGCLPAGFGSRM